MYKKSLLSIVALLLAVCVYADITFSGPDLNSSNKLLFTASAKLPGGGSFDTLFLRPVENGPAVQLTVYPEKMEVLDGGKLLQVRSRYGTALYSSETGKLVWTKPFRGFDDGTALPRGMLEPLSVSPDGRWYVSVRKSPSSAAFGELVLFDVKNSRDIVIAPRVERSLDSVPVSWSPDSSTLIYSYGGTIYFAHPDSFFTVSSLDDKYRKIGQGTIESVSWVSDSLLLYVSGNEVYAIPVSELFTRSLYADLIGAGVLRGKLPFIFNPSSDSFTAASDGNALVFVKDNRAVSYLELKGDDYAFANGAASLPYLTLPGSTVSTRVIWPDRQLPIIWIEGMEKGKLTAQAWKLENKSLSASLPGFMRLQLPAGAGNLAVSPDEKKAAFIAGGYLYVFDTGSWTQTAVFRDEPVLNCAWAGNDSLYVGGTQTVRLWTPGKSQSSVLFLSSASGYGWNEQGDGIVADTASAGRFIWNPSTQTWSQSPGTLIRNAMTINSNWRIYLDASENGYYNNALYARSSAPQGKTIPLIREPAAISLNASDIQNKDTDTPGVFSHGSRTGRKQVALTFDALDNADGLSTILKVLADYGIEATFFVNGEFIRRHPSAVRDIADSGHQAGSLFFTTYDLSSPEFRIDEDFILRGLARNEDDYYAATGKELSLFWHTPYYMVNSVILGAGKQAGYVFTGGDVFPPDWMTLESALSAPGMYKPAAVMADDILKKVRNGSIIPISAGRPSGTRGDYLYEKLAVIVDSLIKDGYEIVPVSVLAAQANQKNPARP